MNMSYSKKEKGHKRIYTEHKNIYIIQIRMNMFAEQKDTKKPIRLLNQGTYGCIFKPGLTCEGMVDESSKEITKIQKERETSENEVYIGERIQEIKNYSRYFAPVVERCDVDIGTIEDSELKKCEFIDDDKKAEKSMSYEINKIPYVGKKTLGEYIQTLLEQNTEDNKFSNYFINSYKILLEALHKLSTNGIVHYDIKENNVMCRDTKKRPIIIDFGLSFVAEEVLSLENNELFDVFYAHAPIYAPWCIDIDILSYIINVVGKDMETVKDISQLPAAIEMIDEEIENYFEKNTGMNDVFDMKGMETIKENLRTYFKKLITKVGFGSIKWEKVMTELMTYHNTWDVYSLTLCYLQLFAKLRIDEVIVDVPFMNQFKQMLIEVVQAIPSERKSAKEVLKQLKTLSVVQVQDLQQIKTKLAEFNENEENITQRRERFADFKVNSQQQYNENIKK